MAATTTPNANYLPEPETPASPCALSEKAISAELTRVHTWINEFADRLQQVSGQPISYCSPRKKLSIDSIFDLVNMNEAIVRCEACIPPLEKVLSELETMKWQNEQNGQQSNQKELEDAKTETRKVQSELQKSLSMRDGVHIRLKSIAASAAALAKADTALQGSRTCEDALQHLEKLMEDMEKQVMLQSRSEKDAEIAREEILTFKTAIGTLGSRLEALAATAADVAHCDVVLPALSPRSGPVGSCENTVTALETIMETLQKQVSPTSNGRRGLLARSLTENSIDDEFGLGEEQLGSFMVGGDDSDDEGKLSDAAEIEAMARAHRDRRDSDASVSKSLNAARADFEMLSARLQPLITTAAALAQLDPPDLSSDAAPSEFCAIAVSALENMIPQLTKRIENAEESQPAEPMSASPSVISNNTNYTLPDISGVQERATCHVCDSKLGKRYMNPRHQCRTCGQSVCGTCSPSSVRLSSDAMIRVCTPCITKAFSNTQTESIDKFLSQGELNVQA